MTIKQDQAEIKALLEALKKPEPEPKPDSSLSKHVVTIGVSVITAALIFCGTFVYSSNAKITEMSVQLKYVSESVNELKKKSDDAASQFITRNEFEKVRTDRSMQLSDVESRLRALEARRK